MLSGELVEVPMTKALAFKAYVRVRFMANIGKDDESEHSKTFLGAARMLLECYPVEPSRSSSRAVLPDASDVLGKMLSLLPDAAQVFTVDYFRRPTYPVKVLHMVAELYGAAQVDGDYRTDLELSVADSERKDVTCQIWLAHALGLCSASTDSVVYQFTAARPQPRWRKARQPTVPQRPAREAAAACDPSMSSAGGSLTAPKDAQVLPASEGSAPPPIAVASLHGRRAPTACERASVPLASEGAEPPPPAIPPLRDRGAPAGRCCNRRHRTAVFVACIPPTMTRRASCPRARRVRRVFARLPARSNARAPGRETAARRRPSTAEALLLLHPPHPRRTRALCPRAQRARTILVRRPACPDARAPR